jgi:capsular exopolysaccharide synthesis family protein
MLTGLPSPISDVSPSRAPLLDSPGARGFGRETPTDLDWRVYVNAVRRRKRLVFGMLAFGLAAGFGVSRLLKPTYLAEANLWVEVPKDAGGNPGPTWSSQLLGSAGWIDLLRSDLVLLHAVRSQRLYLKPATGRDADALAGFSVKPEFRAGEYLVEVDETGRNLTITSKGDEPVAIRAAAADSIGKSLGFAWLPARGVLTPGRVIEFEVVSITEARQKLLENLVVRPGRERSFIHLELRGEDPELIAATVNSMATRFVEIAGDLKRQKLTQLAAILGEQLEQAEISLARAESQLKGFRTSTATLRVQEKDPTSLGFLTTRVEQEQVRADREAINRVLASVESGGGSVRALEPIGAVQRSPDLVRALQDLTTKEAELRALRSRYTDEYPGVQQLASEVRTLERGTILSLARALTTELTAQDGRLASRVASVSQGLRDMSPLPVEEGRLARNVRVAEELFVSLRERYEESRLAEVSITPDVRLLDAASTPEEPIYDRAPLAIFLALVVSFALAVVTAVVVEMFDPKVRYPAQVARELGVPLLGVVPHVARGSGSNLDNIAPVIEALRGVRLNVLHAHGAAGPLMLTVTSPGMGDGKSFVTSNLALAFADAGYRTLLIDGDIRRGALHRVLNASRKPGLTDFLEGEVSADAVVQSTMYPCLSFIGSGARRRGGPELLSSATMARFVNGLRSSFDVILIDSSPLAAGIDPYALGTLTGNLMLVVRAGVTNRQLAGAKLDVLDRLPIRILGSVVNDIRPGADYNYYSYYLAGYELDEEVPGSGAGRRILPQARPATAAAAGAGGWNGNGG